jgi:hypothetical protein
VKPLVIDSSQKTVSVVIGRAGRDIGDHPGNVVPRDASPQGGVNRFEVPRAKRPAGCRHRPDPIESQDSPSHAAALKHCAACHLIRG